jgi:hypothetical protein
VTGSAACPNPTFSCQSRLESFGTARGRAGAGMEFAFLGNWSAKVEALYFDLGTDNYIVDSPADQSVNAFHSGVVVRGGINYRFNWGGPLVARY